MVPKEPEAAPYEISDDEDMPELEACQDAVLTKARRQGLGLIKFIGEVFKLRIITERIIHECTKKLLGSKNPGEEEIENLCQRLTTAGRTMDTSKAKAHIDPYFQRMKDFMETAPLSPRMKFILLDVIELRHRKWASPMGVDISFKLFDTRMESNVVTFHHARLDIGNPFKFTQAGLSTSIRIPDEHNEPNMSWQAIEELEMVGPAGLIGLDVNL
ncbi:ARM repeat-containing protein [Coniophora puteana RWD-64-598 SS2]|uniref:ARM repeat-containing protein n=1 Tax=Coniophora puteana (strain RWD-64-598) TaxID=741705 RepID=A0A5M3MYN0_CONPW|nr:ARM repeat-containing protein [Coniophora puteana RWD-64-598 SS2]EIW83894.1 ARM repeat-containing protein [Coniophora puteana RWD-64-598 SS2]